MESIHKGTRPTKIAEFEVLRALAILLLLVHHGGIYNFSVGGYSLQPLLHYVQLYLLGSFVFLAGYLLPGSYSRRGARRFWVSRLVRVVIPYWVALGLFFLLLDVDAKPVDVLIHLFGGQMILAPRLTTPILTLWFIGLTLAYYALFGLLLSRFRGKWTLALAILMVFVAAAFLRVEYALLARRFFYYFFVFAAGVLIGRNGLLDCVTSARFCLLDKLALAALGIAALHPFDAVVGEAVSLPLIAAINVYVLGMVLLTLSLLRLVLARRPLPPLVAAVSQASFFAYLLHRPIWDLALSVWTPDTRQTLAAYLILVALAVVLPLAYLLQRGYDRLGGRLEQRLTQVVA
jgi:peptidoglycan/LPS O-acetylase OafA/YrhL